MILDLSNMILEILKTFKFTVSAVYMSFGKPNINDDSMASFATHIICCCF